MFLCDIDIKKGIKTGAIVIRPFNKKQLQMASYDVVLGNEFQVTNRHSTALIDPFRKIFPKTRTIRVKDGDAFILHPGESVLGKQKEFIGVDHNHLILLSGKSSLARAGLVVHNTAMLFNPGHHFFPTFELVNTNNVPLVLRPGMEVAQLMFARLTGTTSKGYEGHGRFDKKNSNHFPGAHLLGFGEKGTRKRNVKKSAPKKATKRPK